MAGLTVEQLDRFHEDGFLVVEDVLTEADLEGIEAEYREIVDRVSAELVEQGKIRPLAGTTFSEKYIEAMQQLDDMYDLYQHLDISLPLLDELDSSHTMNAGREVFGLLTNRRLLDIVESVIGPEIYSNPVQHTRIKPPARHLPGTALDANIAATLWHQDSAVIDAAADGTDMLTVWLALTDATIENGCLIVERGSHHEDMTLHCPGKIFPAEIFIPESIIDGDRVMPMEVPAGGLADRSSPASSPAASPTPSRSSPTPRNGPISGGRRGTASPGARCRCTSTPGGKPTHGNPSAPDTGATRFVAARGPACSRDEPDDHRAQPATWVNLTPG